MAKLVQRLRPYVTVFSAALPMQCKHGDKLLVGGRVTSILNIGELFQGTRETAYAEQEGVYVTLDDSLGEINLCLPQQAYKNYQDKHGELSVGDDILCEGILAVVDTTHSYEGPRGKRVTTDIHKHETSRVLGYNLAPLPEESPQEVL